MTYLEVVRELMIKFTDCNTIFIGDMKASIQERFQKEIEYLLKL